MVYRGKSLVVTLALLLPSPAMSEQDRFTPLFAALERLRITHGIPGYAVTLVRRGGEQRSGSGGVADLRSGTPINEHSLVRIGSITKTFNALAVMQLVDSGKLELDTPLRKLAPDAPLDNPWARQHPVRVVHLLEHRSGLMDMTYEEFEHNEPFDSLEQALAYRPEARQLHWKPGQRSWYSNTNAGLLGLVIERACDCRWADYIQGQLLTPMGMTSASPYDDEASRKRLVTGYDRDGHTPIPYWYMIFPPLGAINATPHNMGALPRLFLDRGQAGGRAIVTADAVARMEYTDTPDPDTDEGSYYAYGAGLNQSLRGGVRWYGHGGDADGYLSRFEYSPQLGAGYFVVINAFRQKALNAMVDVIRDHLASVENPH